MNSIRIPSQQNAPEKQSGNVRMNTHDIASINTPDRAMSHNETDKNIWVYHPDGVFIDQKIEQNTTDKFAHVSNSTHNFMKSNRMHDEGTKVSTVSMKASKASVGRTDAIPQSVADIPFYKPKRKTKVKNHTRYLNLYKSIIDKHDKQIKTTPFFVLAFLNIVKNKIQEKEDIDVTESIDLLTIAQRISRDLPRVLALDEFYSYVADSLITLSSHHYYYGIIASYVCVMRLHSITAESFLDTAHLLQINLDKNNDPSPILSDEIFVLIKKHHKRLQAAMDMERDYSFDYFGLKTLERSYLYKLQFTKYQIIERPQHLIMRVALGIHGSDIDAAIETYDMMSGRLFTHATPTLFNSGTVRAQMSSCFLQAVDDSIESIMDAVKDIGFTSKWSGGIGVHLSALRGRGSLIRGTNGMSLGIIPLCVMLNKEAKYINQGGKRNGSIACYLEPWHSDIYDFCDLRKDTGNDDNRAHDLYLALWIPDLFMERVRDDGVWSLMCPDECPGLNLVHSDQFKRLYEQYEREGRYKKQVKARDLWKHIVASQGETGFPYTLFKDHANSKSNQQNLGTIRSSNLCAEIIQYSDEEETAVCNLASVCLPRFVVNNNDGTMSYNHEGLMKVVRVIVRNLDKIIDRNYYPTEKTKVSNMRHRPMGIGVQGLADLFNTMGYGFDTPDAKRLNKEVFESIYYAAISESMELAKKNGPYSSFEGSEFSKGRLQFHLWGLTEDDMLMGYDWKTLVENVKTHGTRNSLLTAVMPTASSSQIMGNSECCEPRMSNVFTRTTLAGMFVVVNPFLMKDLMAEGLWSEDMRKKLIIYNGSVQEIDEVPDRLKETYKTAYELDQMHLVEQSADRGAFVDQSQSFNLFFAKPSFDLQTSALFGGWEAGLKTGEYYLRTQPAVNPIQFGIDIDDIKRLTGRENIRDFISDNYGVESSDDNSSANDTTSDDAGDPNGLSNTTSAGRGGTSSRSTVCLWKPGMSPADCLSCGA
jgi:ribonucleoside-diphosphate reductase alpha chain